MRDLAEASLGILLTLAAVALTCDYYAYTLTSLVTSAFDLIHN